MAPKKKTIGPRTKSVPALTSRQVNPDWHGFFEKLTGAVVGFDPRKPDGIVSNLVGALGALFKLKPLDLEQETTLLIQRSLARAISGVVEHAVLEFGETLKPTKEIAQRFDEKLREMPVSIGPAFFQDPTRLQLLGQTARWVADWLRKIGISEDEANEAVTLLPSYFASEVADEYRKKKKDYPQIKEEYDPKFVDLVESERAWMKYHTSLQTRANPEVLDLGITLDQVYVELRAYAEMPNRSEADEAEPKRGPVKPRRKVGWLKDMAEEWIARTEPSSAILALSGGPGSGKSAFSRRFAAWRAWAGPDRWKVLFVPLHRFEVGRELQNAVEAFASRELGEPVKLFDPKCEDPLLLVFDGLDELDKQGKLGEEDAADFYRQVEALVQVNNKESCRIKVLLCGRPVSVSLTRAAIRLEGSVLHALPYFVTKKEQAEAEYEGLTGLLDDDDRNFWWQNYQRSKDQPIEGLPIPLQSEKLLPLTAEPMLNGLLARVLASNDGRSIHEETNRAQVYEWLLEDVFARLHDPAHRVHLKDLNFNDFSRLMEEVALAAWHGGDVRSTTHKEVVARCEESGVGHLLKRVFPNGKKDDVTALFLSFYFRQALKRRGEDEAYEFAHKSFGEYLLTRRWIRLLKELRSKSEQPLETFRMVEALTEWAEIFGPTKIDGDLHDFVCDQVARSDERTAHSWQQLIVQLINATLRDGMPMDKLALGKFREMNRRAINAEQALIVLHSACAKASTTLEEIDWPGDEFSKRFAPGDWFGRILGQRRGGFDIARCLNGFPLSSMNLSGANLSYADLAGANLRYADLTGAKMTDSILPEANLSDATLIGADLTDAFMSMARLSNANLTGANLITAQLSNADLSNAQMSRADFSYAFLQYAKLSRAILTNANFSGADLSYAKLSHSRLSDARVFHAKLCGADLSGADLSDANFYGANLTAANLSGANLTGTRLSGANLSDANLSGANLSGADLSSAILSRANLINADFHDADLSSADLLGSNIEDSQIAIAKGQPLRR